MYNVVWPTAGSLTAMIETGANGVYQLGGASVTLALKAAGQPIFSALDAGGKDLDLATREWLCADGILETRALLSGGTGAQDSNLIDDSVIRLWKASDGALIAENTVESAQPSASGSSTHRRPLARFYFRLSPASPVAVTP